MRFGVLGPLQVVRADVEVPLARRRERRLLAALLVNFDEVVSTDRLVEAVWPGEEQPVRPTRALQTLVSRLRASLGEESVTTGTGGYRLRTPPSQVDACLFEESFSEARTALENDPETALVALDEALRLWRGEAYEEFAGEPFAQAEAVRLEELRVAALETRAEARLALGQHEELVAELQVLVARHPFSERLRHQLMVALYRSGRQAEALAAFQSYRRLMAEELGLEPSPSLRQLERRILLHDLEPVAPAHRRRPPQRRPSPRLGEELGVPTSRLIGRESDTARLLDVLREARLVTLTGPGGVGKTRLAAHVAGQVADLFDHGVAACTLAVVRDPAAVPSSLASALGVRQRQHRTIEESIVDALGQKALLLVLDNCEHVVEVAARLVSFLLRCCPRLTVLATSRARLGLAAEHVVDVAPLTVPRRGSRATTGTAMELFYERARAAGVELATDDSVRAPVGEICRRLDGLPLAVELAAAHVRAMRPADIAERLATSPSLVGTWLRDVPDRHRSLGAVADWSYELLGAAEKKVFEGLSVFAGSFDLDAVEQVCAIGEPGCARPVELLESLVDSSMVAVHPAPGPTRYLLLETLRSYGRQQLVRRGAQNRWRQAHARHYLHLAERAEQGLASPAEDEWSERLDQELDNLREARRWGLEQDLDLAVRLVAALTHFRWSSLHTELELWAEETADRAPEHPLAPLLLGSAALGAWSRGEFERTRRLAASAIAAEGREDAKRVAVEALAAISLVEGDLTAAVEGFARATGLARGAGDRFHEGLVLGSQAIALGYLQQPEDAERRVGDVEAIGRELGCPSLLAWSLYARGERLVEMEPQRSLRLLDRSEALARQARNHFVRAVAGISATTVRARQDEPSSVLPRFRELIEHLEGLGNRTQLWTTVRSLIQVLAKLGDHEAAAVLHGALEASATAVAPFGPDHDRLQEAAKIMAEHDRNEDVEAWKERGRGMGDQEAIAYAIAAIDRALEASRGAR